MLNYGGNLPSTMTQKFLYVVDHFIPFPDLNMVASGMLLPKMMMNVLI